MMGTFAALVLAAAAAVAPPSTDELEWMLNGPYPNGDPLYSEPFDRLAACVAKLAPTYRFDFNRPNVSAAQQAADAVRSACAAEVAALRAITDPVERSDDPAAIVGALDVFFIDPLFDASRIPGAPDRSTYRSDVPPGTTRLVPTYRLTYLPVAAGFRPGETVEVQRFDAYAAPNIISSFEQHLYYAGTSGPWRYSYFGSYGSWRGYISDGTTRVSIDCQLPYSGVMTRTAKDCEIKVDAIGFPTGNALLRLRGEGTPFRIRGFCNPGHIDGSDVIIRPPPPSGSPLAWARNATLTIDRDAPVALPDGAACLRDPKGALLARVLAATHVRAAFIPKFDTRTLVREGSPRALQPALELAKYLNALTFDPKAKAAMATNQQTLWHRAQPFTAHDALSQRPEWTGTLRCLRRTRAATKAAIEAALDGACRDWFADLASHAASLKARTVMYAKPPESVPGGADRAREARRLVVEDAAQRGQPPSTFAPNERAAQVMGEPGAVGVALAFRESGSEQPQEYGYVLGKDVAKALIPPSYPTTFSDASAVTRSLRLECRRGRKPACTIEIPTDDGIGAFLLHTDGPWHGAKLCARYPGADFATWTLKQYSFDEEAYRFSADGCLAAGDADVIRIMAWGSGPFFFLPGEEWLSDRRGVHRTDVDFALALAGYLADRLQ